VLLEKEGKGQNLREKKGEGGDRFLATSGGGKKLLIGLTTVLLLPYKKGKEGGD